MYQNERCSKYYIFFSQNFGVQPGKFAVRGGNYVGGARQRKYLGLIIPIPKILQTRSRPERHQHSVGSVETGSSGAIALSSAIPIRHELALSIL